MEKLLRERDLDAVTFASSSTVDFFFQLLPDACLAEVTLACIGPVTADTLRTHGHEPQVVAKEHSLPELIRALEEYWTDGL